MDFPAAAVRVDLDDLLSLRGYVRRIARRAQTQPMAELLQKKHGRGLEFAGLRPYMAGDEARHIDWRVFARSGEVHTRQFYPESTHIATISVDRAPSMQFGSTQQSKWVQVHRLAAALAWHLSESSSKPRLLSDQPPNLAHAIARWIETPDQDWLLHAAVGDHYVFSDFSESSIETALAAHGDGAWQHWVWLTDPAESATNHKSLPFRWRSKLGAATAWLSSAGAKNALLGRRQHLQALTAERGIGLTEISTADGLSKALHKVLGHA